VSETDGTGQTFGGGGDGKGADAREERSEEERGIRILATMLRSAATAIVRRSERSIWNRMRLGFGIGFLFSLPSNNARLGLVGRAVPLGLRLDDHPRVGRFTVHFFGNAKRTKVHACVWTCLVVFVFLVDQPLKKN
jgi:hypothetical protein